MGLCVFSELGQGGGLYGFGVEGVEVGPDGAQQVGGQQAAFGGQAGVVKVHGAGLGRDGGVDEGAGACWRCGGVVVLQGGELRGVCFDQGGGGGLGGQPERPGAGADARADEGDGLGRHEGVQQVKPGGQGGSGHKTGCWMFAGGCGGRGTLYCR